MISKCYKNQYAIFTEEVGISLTKTFGYKNVLLKKGLLKYPD